MDRKADVVVWRSEIDSVMLEDLLENFDSRSW